MSTPAGTEHHSGEDEDRKGGWECERVLLTTITVQVDYLVVGDEDVRLPEDLAAIATPGHAPGHTSFLLDRAGAVLFVGMPP